MMIANRRYYSPGFLGFSAALLVLLSSTSDSSATTVTSFTIVDSAPSSWVARGYNDYTVTPELGWTFTTSRNYDNGVRIYLTGPSLPGTEAEDWNLNFGAPYDELITPGFYPDCGRFHLQGPGLPGLGFTGNGRGDNTAGGFFEVFEATYGPDGEVLSFSADFTHYGEENFHRWAVVEVRYNAAPEPGTAFLALFGLPLLCRRRRGRTVVSPDNRGIEPEKPASKGSGRLSV